MDVGKWLEDLGLGDYAPAFAENHIDDETLAELTGDDLKELGIASLGHRKRLLAAIARLGDGTAASPGPAPAVAASPEGERRQVTILFVDLSGYTKLSGELDAEDLHGLVDRFLSTMDGVVEAYGGTVDKHIGDAVMALFGAPVAHSDDPERALRAAFDMHEAARDLGRQLGRDLAVHIGIASGQVVAGGLGGAGYQEYTVVGDSVNLAARLNDRAEAGETLLSDAVQGAVAHLIDSENLGPQSLPGISAPVQIWRPRALRGATADSEMPFVGRQAELAQFTGILEACLETSSGQAALLRGEAGIGKTRLAAKFAALAESKGFAGHKGLVLDFGAGKGRDAIRSLVRSLLALAPGSDERDRLEAADGAVARGAIQPDLRVALNDLLDLPQPTELRALYDAMDNETRNRQKQRCVGQLVGSAARERPRLLLIEDIHWADPVTLGQLSNLTAGVRDCAAVLVMTSRIEGDPTDAAWRTSIRNAPLLTMDLAPLRSAEAAALASTYLEASNLLAERCIERAEGNPLFLVQLLRNAEEGAQDEVPGSIQSLVHARVDRLASADKQALQAASVIGQRFGLDALRALIDRPDYKPDELLEHQLIGPEGDGFLFAHALIQEGVYGSLLKSRAQELHGKAAAWFADRDLVLWAGHLGRAEDPGAPAAYLAAAEAQLQAYHFELALRMVRRGLELAQSRADKWALTRLLGQLLLDQGAPEDSKATFEEALQLAEGAPERSEALFGLASSMRLTDDFDGALDALQRAEAEATEGASEPDLARIHSLRGNIYFPLGRIEDCRREHEAALAHARRAESSESEAQALSGLADAAYAKGRMASAFKYFSDCVALSHRNGYGRIEVANRSMVGFSRHYLNQLDQALEDAEAAIDAAVKVGHLRAELLGHILAYFIRLDRGDYDKVMAHIERGQDLVRQLGAWRFEAQHLLVLAMIQAATGDKAQALNTIRNALQISRDTSFAFSGPRCLSFLAQLTSDPEERQRALEEGQQVLDSGAVGHNHFFFYRSAMETALEHGEWDAVEKNARALEAYTAEEPLPWSDFFIARARALTRHRKGERGPGLREELERLCAEGSRVGLIPALAALQEALADHDRGGATHARD